MKAGVLEKIRILSFIRSTTRAYVPVAFLPSNPTPLAHPLDLALASSCFFLSRSLVSSASLSFSGRPRRAELLSRVRRHRLAVLGGFHQSFLDPQQLVVLRVALGAARGACFQVARAKADGQIRDEGILRFTTPVRHKHAPLLGPTQRVCLEAFSDGANLIDLEKHSVGGGHVHPLLHEFNVRAVKVVSYDLHRRAHIRREFGVRVKCFLVKGVFDQTDGVFAAHVRVELHEGLRAADQAAILVRVFEVEVVLWASKEQEGKKACNGMDARRERERERERE